MEDIRYILASKSPRRRELLAEVLDDFEVVSSRAEEFIVSEKSPMDMAMDNALKKALAISVEHHDAIVIGADTVVVLNDVVMGKPTNLSDAINMLKALSGRTHQVVTGVALVYGERQMRNFEVSDVTFKVLDANMIEQYVKDKRPLDKAGAYGIQEVKECFVEKLEGNYNNVVGLPTDLVAEMLENMILSING